ncbi:penicillin acylase family protein, partial [candidate division KSB1 bacterium]|nr:penicillin acylase family protein [candidate division KSB1 bacterium]
MKKYALPVTVIFLLISACIGVFTVRSSRNNSKDRLDQFPLENIPLELPVTLYWNSHMVPFIHAQTDRDAAFFLGMVHTHLRWAQMELMRRITQGRLAESAGPFAVKIDHSIRVLQLDAAVDSMIMTLPEKTRTWLQNYVDGINCYQKRAKKYPFEFKYMALRPEPWTIRDVLVLGRLVSVDVSWFNWFSMLRLRQKSWFPDIWAQFVELGSSSTPSFYSQSGSLLDAAVKSGSNAYVISGAKTEDGFPIMASDPHLGLQLPNTWMIAGYKCPSYHVLGLMFPGIPMVLVGRNPYISWAGTNMRSASSDVYEIKDNSVIQERPDTIKVRLWRDKKITVRTTPVGPLLSDVPLLNLSSDQVLALKWVGHQPSDEFSSFLRVNAAMDWPSFCAAFDGYAVSGQNFLYADARGHIGMLLAVKIPKRSHDYFPDLVLDPKNPAHQWYGYFSSGRLPHIYDPPKGYIASSNNRPASGEPPVGYFFSGNDRIDRLYELLSQKDTFTLQDVLASHEDVFVFSAQQTGSMFVRKLTQLNLVSDSTCFQILKNWDGKFEASAQGPVVYQILLYYFTEKYYTQKYDKDIVDLILSAEQIGNLVRKELVSGDSVLVASSLKSAFEQTVKRYRKYPTWGDMHRLALSHPFAYIPLLGRRFRIAEYPVGGSYGSLMKTAHQVQDKKHRTFYGANSRFIALLSDPDENYFVLLGGQDGWFG